MTRHDPRLDHPVGALRFDAGSLALNLVATVGRRFGEPLERLESVERLDEWLAGVGLKAPARLSERDVRRVRELRTHLDALFYSVLAGRRPERTAVVHVNTTAARGPQLRPTTLDLAADMSDPISPILSLVSADALRILASAERLQLRTCEAVDCRMIFLATGNRPRRWCSSVRCGNRSRVAAHRARIHHGGSRTK